MKAEHLRRILARHGRVKHIFGNHMTMKRFLRTLASRNEGLPLANRVHDITALVGNDVPEMVAWITRAKQEKIKLLQIIRTLNEQLEGTITELDPEPGDELGPEDNETPAYRDA